MIDDMIRDAIKETKPKVRQDNSHHSCEYQDSEVHNGFVCFDAKYCKETYPKDCVFYSMFKNFNLDNY